MAKVGFGVGVHPYTYYPGTGTTPPSPGRVHVPAAETVMEALLPAVLGHSAVTVLVPTHDTVMAPQLPTVQTRTPALVLLPSPTDTVAEALLPIVRSRTNRVLAPVHDTEMAVFAPDPFIELAIPSFFYDGLQGDVVWASGTANAVDGQTLFGFFCVTKALDGQRQVIFRGRGTVLWEVAFRSDDRVEFNGNGGAMFACATPPGQPTSTADGLLLGIFRCQGTTAELVVYRQSDPLNPLVGVSSPGVATNIEFTAATYVGQSGAPGDFFRGNWHIGGWGFFSRALSPETVEQIINSTTAFPRFPGVGGAGYFDGAEDWEVMLMGTTGATNSGLGGAPTSAGSLPPDTSPGSYAPDLVLTGFPLRPGVVDTRLTPETPALVQARRHGVRPPALDTRMEAPVPVVTPAPDPELANVQSFNTQAIVASPVNLGAYTASGGSNRKFLFFEAIEVDATGSGITGLTWGGVPAVSVIRRDFAPALNIAQWWEIAEADFPIGATGDIIATIATPALAPGTDLVAFACTGRNMEQVAAEATASAAVTTNTSTVTPTTLTDRALVVDGVSVGNAGVVSVTQGPSQVQEGNVSVAGGRSMVGAISSRFVAVAAAAALGWSHAGTANRFAHVAAAFRRAGAAAPPGAAALVFSDSEINTANANANAGSKDFNSIDLGAAASGRKIIACFACEASVLNAPTGVTVTPSGGSPIAMTQVETILINGGQLAIYIADVPSGATGDFHIDWNNSRPRHGFVAFRAEGIDSTPHDVVEAIGLDLSASLAVPAGGVAMGIVVTTANNTGGITWVGLTQDVGSTMENAAWLAAASDASPTPGALAVDAQRGMANTGDCAIYISFAPA